MKSTIDKILAEFDEVFYEIMGLETDPEGTPDMLLIRDEEDYVLNSMSFTPEKEAIKSFLTESIVQAIAEERERMRGEIEKLYEEFSVHPNENDREYMVQRFRLFTDKILSSLPLTDKE